METTRQAACEKMHALMQSMDPPIDVAANQIVPVCTRAACRRAFIRSFYTTSANWADNFCAGDNDISGGQCNCGAGTGTGNCGCYYGGYGP